MQSEVLLLLLLPKVVFRVSAAQLCAFCPCLMACLCRLHPTSVMASRSCAEMRRIVLPDPRSVQLLKRQVTAAMATVQAAAPRPRKPAASRRKPPGGCIYV